jgi:tetratricopeptide (TPR) repeat protein
VRYLVIALTVALGACAARSAAPEHPYAGVTAEQLYERGRAFDGAGDSIRAEQYYAAALERGHAPDELLPALVRVCVSSARYGAALRWAMRLRDRHPEAWRLQFLVAALHTALGEDAAARSALEQVVGRWPAQPEPHFALAELYARTGDGDRARRHYDTYLDHRPRGPHALEARAGLQAIEAAERERRRAKRSRRRR